MSACKNWVGILGRRAERRILTVLVSGLMAATLVAQTNPPPPPPPPPPNPGTNFNITPPPTGSLVQVSNQGTENGDDNLVWSHSGRYIAVDRSDPTAQTPSGNKNISVINLSDLGNIQQEGARSSAAANPVLPNITDWTWNDDRILFGNIPISGGKSRFLSCTAFGATNMAEFLKDPSGALHVFAPSVVYDPVIQKERLLFLTSTSTGDPTMDNNPATRVNVWTVPFESGGLPQWADKVKLTAFDTTNICIQAVKWCPELGTNYQPLVDRYALVIMVPGSTNPPPQVTPANEPPSPPSPTPSSKAIVVFSGVRDILNDVTLPPTTTSDARISIRESNASAGSQVSWTQNGVYMMYCKNAMRTNQPPAAQQPPPQPQAADELFSVRSVGNSAPAIFETPVEFIGSNKQWLCISPDGMRAAFTINKKVYVMPMQFDNMAVAGSSNLLSDGGYTIVNIPNDALNSNYTFNIRQPNTVDTNTFPSTMISGSARNFSVEGQTNEHFYFQTNVDLMLHFESNAVPAGVPETNLAIFTYEPGTNGQSGTWSQEETALDPTNKFVSAEVQKFSIYVIGTRIIHTDTGTPVPGDYDGDGRTDPAVFSEGNWYVWMSSSGYQRHGPYAFGASNDIPVGADFDGDGLVDPAVCRNGNWYIWLSASGYQPRGPYTFSVTGATPLAGDFDGDGRADPVAYLAGNWYVWFSTSGYQKVGPYALGTTGAPAVGDFDGDGRADAAVFTGGNWYVWTSSTGYRPSGPYAFGTAGYSPVVGDYDGDGRADPAVFNNGYWYVYLSTQGYALAGPYQFGLE